MSGNMIMTLSYIKKPSRSSAKPKDIENPFQGFPAKIHCALLLIIDDGQRRMIFRPLHGCEGMISKRGMSKVLWPLPNWIFFLF